MLTGHAKGGGQHTGGPQMKALTLALLLSTAAVPVLAADMPVKAPPRYVEPVSDWTGFYVFGFGGYSWGKLSPDDFNVADVDDRLHNPKPKGGVFGFGGGYLWQYGGWVGGLEVDYGFSSEKETQSIFDSARIENTTISNTATLTSKIDALGSARARIGYLFAPSLLAYGTAGVGWGHARVSASDTFCVNTKCLSVLDDTAKQNLFGWVAGGGIEYKLFEHLRIRGEYLHYDFGSQSFSFQSSGLIGLGTINVKTRDDVARGALIWSFN